MLTGRPRRAVDHAAPTRDAGLGYLPCSLIEQLLRRALGPDRGVGDCSVSRATRPEELPGADQEPLDVDRLSRIEVLAAPRAPAAPAPGGLHELDLLLGPRPALGHAHRALTPRP